MVSIIRKGIAKTLTYFLSLDYVRIDKEKKD
jgi:hypothetical protein